MLNIENWRIFRKETWSIFCTDHQNNSSDSVINGFWLIVPSEQRSTSSLCCVCSLGWRQRSKQEPSVAQWFRLSGLWERFVAPQTQRGPTVWISSENISSSSSSSLCVSARTTWTVRSKTSAAGPASLVSLRRSCPSWSTAWSPTANTWPSTSPSSTSSPRWERRRWVWTKQNNYWLCSGRAPSAASVLLVLAVSWSPGWSSHRSVLCLQSQFLLSLQAISIMVHFYMGTKGPENVSDSLITSFMFHSSLHVFTIFIFRSAFLNVFIVFLSCRSW